MNLTEFAINRSRVAITIFVVIGIMGITMYKGLPQDSMPPYTVRVATVVAQFPGAGPERVENLVTEKIEEKVQEIPELDELNSQSRSGLSVVTITLKDEVEPGKLQAIWDRIRRKLDEIQFPSGVQYQLKDDDIGVVYGIMLGLTSENNTIGGMDYSYAYMKDLADDLRDEFIALEDAAKVEIGGDQIEQIFVEFDNSQLAKYGLTASQLQGIIGSTNILYSGGEMNVGEERIIVEPTGNFDKLEDLKRTIIKSENGQALYLEDIATVTRGYQTPATQIVKVDGKRAISLSVSLKENANIVNLGNVIDQKLIEINAKLPLGLQLKRLSSLDYYVDGEVDNFVNNLVQTIVLVLVVMLIFLGFRTGFIIASLVPMVILATFLVMGTINVGINQVSLAALIMALGMMVDNGVVVSETILVKIEEGKSKYDAAVEACNELFIPLLISTLTTSVAFLSFYLAESVMGDIVGPLFVVISIALIASWLLSLTMITLLCFFFLKSNDGEDKKPTLVDRIINFLKEEYKKLINICLRFKIVTIAAILGAFVGSLFLFGLIPFIFFPDSERNLITVDINLPQGTRIERTQEVVENIEGFLTKDLKLNDSRTRGVIDWSAFIGEGPESYDLGYTADEANSNYAHMLVNTSSGDDNGYVINKIDSFSFEKFPSADIKVKRLGSGGGGTPIEVKVSGKNPEILAKIAEQVKNKLDEQDGTKNVKDDWGPKIKKIVIDIDPITAQNSGITNQDIAISLQTALTGYGTGDFREGDKNITILMRDQNYNNLKVEDLEGINIYSQNSGKNVPLSQVAKISIQWQFAKILRKDLQRSVNISSEITEGGNASKVMSVVRPWLDEQMETEWPDGYFYELGGDAESSADSMGAVAEWLPLSFFIIIMLLIIQFNSVRKTFIVLMTIPLGIIGVILGLLILRSYFGFFAFLGVISLAGIVINNAIVLLDRIDMELENGLPLIEAIKEACLQRFRPILLTTFTTVLGMIPLYTGGGLMWEPLAAAIMVGLLFGTLITLVFVPVMFALLFKNRKTKKVEVTS
ncbi:putative transporter [Flavobacteriaceae bacterium UJ101]|nr:putative transporter [Flavobacteriaceae bacterium UJ101]